MSAKLTITNSRYYVDVHQDLGNADGRTIGECLERICERFLKIRSEVFTGDGKLQLNVCVLLNKYSTDPEPLNCPVHDGDEIEIIIVGGR